MNRKKTIHLAQIQERLQTATNTIARHSCKTHLVKDLTDEEVEALEDANERMLDALKSISDRLYDEK